MHIYTFTYLMAQIWASEERLSHSYACGAAQRDDVNMWRHVAVDLRSAAWKQTVNPFAEGNTHKNTLYIKIHEHHLKLHWPLHHSSFWFSQHDVKTPNEHTFLMIKDDQVWSYESFMFISVQSQCLSKSVPGGLRRCAQMCAAVRSFASTLMNTADQVHVQSF